MAAQSSSDSPIVTLVFGGVLVIGGLGVAAAAKDLLRERRAGKPPTFPEWFSGGWYERRPRAVAVSGYGLLVAGCLALLLGILQLTGVL